MSALRHLWLALTDMEQATPAERPVVALLILAGLVASAVAWVRLP